MLHSHAFPLFRVTAIALAVLASGCTYNVAVPCQMEGNVSYSDCIAPLMEAHCTSCHSSNFPEAGLNLTVHESVAQSAIEGDLKRVLRLPTSDPLFMPQFGYPLAEEDIQLIERWTEQGAPNN